MFAGSYATFHQQYNQMVDILICLRDHNMHRLNPHAELHMPKQEIEEEESHMQRNNNNNDAKV